MSVLYKKKIIENFDKGAALYDQYADIQKQVAIELCRKVTGAPKRILEIGCGTGFLTNELIDKFPDAQITATDISPKMIERCQNKFKENDALKFEVMDGESVRFHHTFDLIISSMTAQWFENMPKALRDLKSCLSESGQIYYTVPHQESFPEWREILTRNNVHSGLIKATQNIGTFETKIYPKQYNTALDFLGAMKKIGAHYSGEEYINLNPAQMRKICQDFDSGKRIIQWMVDYCRIDAS